jgi:23S rRNA (adenine2503-C2)-methyltransferase
LRDDPAEWTDLPAGVRDSLAEQFLPRLLTSVRELRCDGDTTVKTLWRLYDGALVESVLMRYPDRVTICVSSQAGCGMACPFCATGQSGLQRNMSTAEIVEQVMDGERKLSRGLIPGGRGRVSNVVFMGMGEPLANYKAVVGAVRQLVTPTPDGLGLSARGITVSTVGLVPRMQQLATEGLPVTLALSLHAPDDELRDELVPINTRWNVDEVVDAAWGYAKATKRRVSIEYILIRDVNDQAFRADLLAKVLRRRGNWGWVHVNLIPLNPTPGPGGRRPGARTRTSSSAGWRPRGCPVTVATPAAGRSTGACGQLAATPAAP